MPGWVVTVLASASTATTLFIYLLKSMMIAAPMAWPANELPLPRGKTGT